MNKTTFNMAIAKTTVEGTDNYNKALEAVRKDLANVQKEKNLESLKNLAICTLALSCKTFDDADVIEELEDGLEQTVNVYTAVSKLNTYIAARDSDEGAMRYACREYFFPTIRVKETKDKKTKRVTRAIEATLQQIDLLDLHKWVKDNQRIDAQGIGADVNWVYAADKLNIELAKDAATRYGDEETKSRLMDPTNLKAKTESIEYHLNHEGAAERLDEVVKLMLGNEYGTIPMDWELLRDNYVTDNKKSKLGVKLSNPRVFVGLLKKVCHRVVTGSSNYEVATKLLKKQD